MSAILRIDRPANPGINNRSRSDVQLSEVVTLESIGAGAVHTFGLLARPTGSAAALSGGGPTSKDITPDVAGSYRIRLDVDGEIIIHTFTVLTVRRSLHIPSHNERASLIANEVDPGGAGWVEESETNEGDDFRGYMPPLEDLITKVEDSVASPTSSTDNALARFNGVDGAAVQNSLAILDDLGNMDTKSLAAEYLRLKTGITPPAHAPGQLYFDDATDTLAMTNNITGVLLQLGRELWTRSINNTLAVIPDGSVVCVDGASGGHPTICLANSREYDKQVILGVATQDIPIGGNGGEVTPYGKVNDIDTDHLVEGAAVYLSPTVDGETVAVRPGFPAKPIFIGICTVKDAVNGSIFVQIKDDTFDYEFDGCAIERQDTFVVVDTGVVYCDVELVGGGDLPVQLNGEIFLLDCTTGAGVGGRARAALTAGTSTVPEFNFVWVELVAGVPTLKGSATPPMPASDGFAFIAFVAILDAATTTTEGPLVHQRSTDAIAHDDRGRIAYIDERLRQNGAQWTNGIAPTVVIDTVPAPDTVDVTVASGSVYQLHRQTFPSLQASVDGIYMGNASGVGSLTPYQKLTDLGLALEDNAGNSLAGQRFNWVIWGAVNKTTGECKLFASLPRDGYNNDLDAYNDVNQTAVISVPIELRTVAFLIARVPVRHRIPSGGTYEFINPVGRPEIISLLGNPIGVSGSGASGAASQFSDNIFAIFNDADSSKVLDFDVSPVTTATTRTLGAPDMDLNLPLGDGVAGNPMCTDGAGNMSFPSVVNIPSQLNILNIADQLTPLINLKQTPTVATLNAMFTLEAAGVNWSTGSRILKLISSGDNDAVPLAVNNGSIDVALLTRTGALHLDDQLLFLGNGSIQSTVNGNITLLPNGTGITIVGDAGSTSHGLNTNDDFFAAGRGEIDGDFFADGNAELAGGVTHNITTVNAATYDLLISDYLVHVTYTSTNPVTSLTLPTAQTLAGRVIRIIDAGNNAGTNPITIDTQGIEDINGLDTYVIDTDRGAVSLYSDGSDWFIDGLGMRNIGFYASRGSSQTLNNLTETKIQFNSQLYDFGDNYDESTNYRFTAPKDGQYAISASGEITLAAAGRAQLRVYIGSTLRARADSSIESAGTVYPNVALSYRLSEGTTVEIRAWQNSGFTATIQATDTSFSIAQASEF